MNVLHLGLTGGIGSGKSTVATMLEQLGAGLLDADAISRQSTAPQGLAIEAIRSAFGNEYITADGALDRPRMSALCFSQPEARKKLESIIHPLVHQELARLARMHEEQGRRIIVWDIPLLVESAHWRTRLDRVLVVDCTKATQINRVLSRSQAQGLTREESEIVKIIDAQASREQRRACADWVIFNEGLALESLYELVKQVYEQALNCLEDGQSGLSFGV
jgi:dephospho-CoA kinase